MQFPAISAGSPHTILLGCDMTGSYVSHDNGARWRMFNLGGVARQFVIDSNNSRTYYALTGRGKDATLWGTTDSGETWKLVYPDPTTVTGIVENDDHATRQFITSNPRTPAIEAVAVEPGNSHTLYASFQRGQNAELALSRDSGKSWNKLTDLPCGGRSIHVDPASPRNDRSIYVVGRNCVTSRRQGSWKTGPSPQGVNSFRAASLGFADGNAVVYGITTDALFVSRNGGESWDAARLPGSNAQLSAIAASALHGDSAYVSFLRLTVDDQRIFGAAKTTDAGRTWSLVWSETSAKPAANISDYWLTPRFGPAWGGAPLGLAVAPDDPDFAIATDLGRTMRTRNGGKTWESVYSKALEDGSFTSAGLDVTTNYGLHFDPFDSKRMFIDYTDIGLFRSENGGMGWQSATQTVPRRWVNTTYWMVFDPVVRGRAWAVMSNTHDLPRPKMWRRQPVANYAGGVAMSDDGGRTWSVSNDGMPQTAATHILLDQSSPPDARVLYVAAFGRGVYKSVDGGKSWLLKNDGLPLKEPFAWRLAEAPDRALYLVVARRSEDGSYGNDRDGALYRSADGAGYWNRISLPEGLNGPNGIAIDPRDASRLYLAAWGRQGAERASMGGVWVSADGGATWRNTLSRDQYVYDVTIDPRNPNILYACGFSSSAWRSEDRGETWRRIPGYNFKWGHRVIPDPLDPAKIYITTYGGSVWHGPAKGDPRAKEDIVTPQVAYGR